MKFQLGRKTLEKDLRRIRVMSARGSSVRAPTVHSALLGLSADDHGAVYPSLSDTETISGDWTFSNALTLSDALSVGAAGFTVGATGDITKINGVACSWDNADGNANDVLMTDGAGSWTWQPVSTAGLAPNDAQYVVLALDADLSAERVLVAGTGMTLTDGGANGNATLDVVGGDGITANADDIEVDYDVPNFTFGTGNTMGSGTPVRSGAGLAVFDNSVPEDLTPDIAASVGVVAKAARRDHTHGVECATATTLTYATTNTEGGATTFARSNHTHAVTNTSQPGVGGDPLQAILSSDASGYLRLVRLGIETAPSYPIDVANDDGVRVGAGGDGRLYVSSDHLYIRNVTSDKDIAFYVNDGGVNTMVLDIDGATSRVGINTVGPRRQLDILHATEPQLRITEVDNVDYVDFQSTEMGSNDLVTDDANNIVTDGGDQIVMSGDGGGLYVNPTGGRIGFMTDDPRAAVEILAPWEQLRLAYDADNWSGLRVSSAGDLWLEPSGGDVVIPWSEGHSLTSSDYVSKMRGWAVSYGETGGHLDVRSAYIDELYVRQFIFEAAMALAGSITLTKSRARVSRDFDVPDLSGTEDLYVEDLEGLEGLAVFEDGDYVEIRYFDRDGGGLIVTSIWGTVATYVDQGNGEQSWTFTTTRESPFGIQNMTLPAGSVVLDYGQTGVGEQRGRWEATVLDQAGAPYTRISEWDTDPWTAANWTVYTQVGNLDGLGPLTGLEWGVFSGTGTDDSDQYLIVSSAQAIFNNIDIEVKSGSDTVISLDHEQGLMVSDGAWGKTTTVFGAAIANNLGGVVEIDSGDVVIGPVLHTTGSSQRGIWWDSSGNVTTIKGDSENYITLAGTAVKVFSNNVETIFIDGGTPEVTIGPTATEHIVVSSTALRIFDASDVYTELTGGVLTLGRTSGGEYVDLSSTNGLRIYGNNTLVFQADNTGDVKAGNTSGYPLLWYDYDAGGSTLKLMDSATEYVEIGGGNIDMYSNGASVFHVEQGISGYVRVGPSSYPYMDYDANAGELRISDSASDYVKLDGDGIEVFGSGSRRFFVDDSGNVTMGQVSTSKANLHWDATAGQLQFRGGASGTQKSLYIDTDSGVFFNTGTSVYNQLWWKDLSLTNDNVRAAVYGYDYGGSGTSAAALVAYGVSDEAQGDTARAIVLATDQGLSDEVYTHWYLATTAADSYIRSFIYGVPKFEVNDDGALVDNGSLVIDQGTADDEILYFESDDVGHGETSLAPSTNTYGLFEKYEGTAGGLLMRGLKDSGGAANSAVRIEGYLDENVNTTKTTAARMGVEVYFAQSSGGAAAVVADGNVFGVRCYRSGVGNVAVMFVDEDGDLYCNAVNETLDTYDDVALARAVELEVAPDKVIRSEFDDRVRYGRSHLEAADLVHFDENGAMMNLSQMTRLHNNVAWRIHVRQEQFIEKVARELEIFKKALIGLGVSPKALLEENYG